MTKEDMIIDFIDDCIYELQNETPRATKEAKVKEAALIFENVISIIKDELDLKNLLRKACAVRESLHSFSVDFGNDIKISNLESFKHEIERMKKGKSQE